MMMLMEGRRRLSEWGRESGSSEEEGKKFILILDFQLIDVVI